MSRQFASTMHNSGEKQRIPDSDGYSASQQDVDSATESADSRWGRAEVADLAGAFSAGSWSLYQLAARSRRLWVCRDAFRLCYNTLECLFCTLCAASYPRDGWLECASLCNTAQERATQ